MTTTTDLKSCCACGNYKEYRDGLCWGCHNAVENIEREFKHFGDDAEHFGDDAEDIGYGKVQQARAERERT